MPCTVVDRTVMKPRWAFTIPVALERAADLATGMRSANLVEHDAHDLMQIHRPRIDLTAATDA